MFTACGAEVGTTMSLRNKLPERTGNRKTIRAACESTPRNFPCRSRECRRSVLTADANAFLTHSPNTPPGWNDSVTAASDTSPTRINCGWISATRMMQPTPPQPIVFEMGARWGRQKRLRPLVAPGMRERESPAPRPRLAASRSSHQPFKPAPRVTAAHCFVDSRDAIYVIGSSRTSCPASAHHPVALGTLHCFAQRSWIQIRIRIPLPSCGTKGKPIHQGIPEAVSGGGPTNSDKTRSHMESIPLLA
jgi:hypothetical protein